MTGENFFFNNLRKATREINVECIIFKPEENSIYPTEYRKVREENKKKIWKIINVKKGRNKY